MNIELIVSLLNGIIFLIFLLNNIKKRTILFGLILGIANFLIWYNIKTESFIILSRMILWLVLCSFLLSSKLDLLINKKLDKILDKSDKNFNDKLILTIISRTKIKEKSFYDNLINLILFIYLKLSIETLLLELAKFNNILLTERNKTYLIILGWIPFIFSGFLINHKKENKIIVTQNFKQIFSTVTLTIFFLVCYYAMLKFKL